MKKLIPVTIILLLFYGCLSLIVCNSYKSKAPVTKEPGPRAQLLRSALAGCNRVNVSMCRSDDDSPTTIIIPGRDSLDSLIEHLEFDDLNSGFHCMCSGKYGIIFYQGTNRLASVTYHHGKSLRWEGWDGDSLFTKASAKYWREWFLKQGESRFEDDHQERLKEAREYKRIHDLFLSSFPEGAEAVFEQAASQTDYGLNRLEKDHAANLMELFPDRKGLAEALARSLGYLSIEGADTGSWNVTSTKEQLVLLIAQSLTLDELRGITSSTDPVILSGAARLFFSEGLGQLYPEEECAQTAAKLFGIVLEFDRCNNAEYTIRIMRYFPCPETLRLLNQLASGEIEIEAPASSWREEPSPGISACLTLVYMDDPMALHLIQEAEKIPDLDEFDTAALKVAQALLGEKGILDASVFKPDSYAIGYGALEALEKEGGKEAIDLVIMAGTRHSWGAVREAAVETAERMTGQNWGPNKMQSAEAARRWWKENKDTYPDTEK